MTKYVESYHLKSLGASALADGDGESTVYTKQIDGGELDDINKFRVTLQALANVSDSGALITVTFKYGSSLQAALTFGSSTPPNGAAALVCQALLSALGGPSVQALHAEGMIAVPPAYWIGVPAAYGAGTEDSDSDQDLVITVTVTGGTGSSVGVDYDENNTGDGVFAATPTLGGSAENGDYVLVCTAEAVDGGTFSVTSPSGTPLSDLTVGVAYSSAHINGTLQDGAIDFVLGDTITVSVATVTNVTPQYVSVEKLSFIENPDIPEPEWPNTYIYSISLLTKLTHALFKDVRFYAELLHHLDIVGVGEATFTRSSGATATWRDGTAHSVGVDEPRFEYTGDTALGIAINTATEVLSFDTANLLSNANTLFWIEEGVIKHTPTDTNPFTAGGVYAGTSGVHIKHVLKFSRVLTSEEINIVTIVLTNYELEPLI